MVEIQILAETELGIFTTPETRVLQRVITYKVPELAPRTLWIDSAKLPDAAWQLANPGKPVPAGILAEGDRVRRLAIEADVARIKAGPQPRKI